MDIKDKTPKTLLQAVRYFSDPDICLAFMVAVRWPDGQITCPRCGSKEVTFLKNARLWKCRTKHHQQKFSAKVGTIFEDSPLSLEKWLPAVWMLVNCKNGISSMEMHRAAGVTQKTAWFMLHRIRKAMQTGTFQKLSGEVEIDESFIGGAARFMHKSKRSEKIKGTGPIGKAVVMGLLERHGAKGHSTVRVKHIADRKKGTLQTEVKAHVQSGAGIFTDELASYAGLEKEYAHNVINHAEEYVRGAVHTNGMENFWSLLKRGIRGTYVSVEPFHLHRYLDEQAFRFNERKNDDGDAGRFIEALSQIVGKRLTYKELIGNEAMEGSPLPTTPAAG